MAEIKYPLTPEERHQKDLEALKKLRPLDDIFMRELFRNDLELAQFMLRIILSKPDLILTKEETQYDLQHIYGNRSITLDVFGIDSKDSMTARFRKQMTEQTLKEQGIILRQWMWIILKQEGSSKICRIHMLYFSRRMMCSKKVCRSI